MTPELQNGTLVEGGDGIAVLRGSGLTRSWNGIRYKTGLSGKNTKARQLSLNVATIPPGGVILGPPPDMFAGTAGAAAGPRSRNASR